ncbi:MAG TPA: hypothetical protein VE935_02555 [Burkholderiales bacterium]|nr:hypothetical protein [Burkholderiales bacterium]
MHQTGERRFLRDFSLAALFCSSLAAASGAAAQSQEIVYSVSSGDWSTMSTRTDGKLTALSFSFGTQAPADRGPTVEDLVLEIPVGGATAAWWKAVVLKQAFASVLIEFAYLTRSGQKMPATGQPGPGQRAPFAVRLSNAVATSVHVSKPKGDSGPGIAEVRLRATTFEVFTATQEPTGAMKAGKQFGWDSAHGKAF